MNARTGAMAMVLIWNDARAFRRHLENMRVFRQSHYRHAAGGPARLKDMPVQGNTRSPGETGGERVFRNVLNEPLLVPVWEIKLPGNSKN